jgi:hypothetical protein
MAKNTIFDNQKKIAHKKPIPTGRQTVQVAAWVKPPIKSELEKIAKKEGLSVSATIAALLEEAIRQKLHIQHAILLEPLIEKSIAKNMRQMATRLSWLLVRVAFDAGQIRGIVTNLLGNQLGGKQELLKTILAESARSARGNITRRTPQMTELMESIEKWLLSGEEEPDTGK